MVDTNGYRLGPHVPKFVSYHQRDRDGVGGIPEVPAREKGKDVVGLQGPRVAHGICVASPTQGFEDLLEL